MEESYARVRLDIAKRQFLRVLLETPQDMLTDDETDILFKLSFSPQQQAAILNQKEER